MALLNSFKCEQCGSCCRNIKRWENYKGLIHEVLGENLEFPYTSFDGICPMLSDDGTCSIYETRPNCCRTEYIYNLLREKYNLSSEDFLFLQNQSCLINQTNNN